MRAYNTLLKDYVDNDPRPLNPLTGLRIGGIDPLAIFAEMWIRISLDDDILIDRTERATIVGNLSALATKLFFQASFQAVEASNVTMINITMAAILFIENLDEIQEIQLPKPRLVNESMLVALHTIDEPRFSFDWRGLQPKIRDFMGNARGCTTAKYLSKRTPCSCLEEIMMYLTPKGGACFHCGAFKPVKELMVCSRCRITQYCSKSCQKAHWPEHKHACFDRAQTNAQEEIAQRKSQRLPSGHEGSNFTGSSFASQYIPPRSST
jgi:hypothetical protein